MKPFGLVLFAAIFASGCGPAPKANTPDAPPVTVATQQAVHPATGGGGSGGGSIAPMGPMGGAGITPVAGSASVVGAGEGSAASGAKDMAKRAAAKESKAQGGGMDDGQ